MLKNSKKGAVTIEYALLFGLIITPIGVGLTTVDWDFLPSCQSESERNLCVLLESTPVLASSTPPGSEEDEVITDFDYDPNHARPDGTPWVFGKGQMYSFAGDEAIYPKEIWPRIDWKLDYSNPTRASFAVTPTDWLASATNSRINRSAGGAYHKHFVENRMLQLDDRVDCGALEGVSTTGLGVNNCRVNINIETRLVVKQVLGSRIQAIANNEIVATLDFGPFVFNWDDVSVHAWMTANTTSSTFPTGSNVSMRMSIFADSDLNIDYRDRHYPDFTIDGGGHTISISHPKATYIQPTNGNFEVNNGLLRVLSNSVIGNQYWASPNYLYKPGAGAVVAAYPYAKENITLMYESLDDSKLYGHAIDIRKSPEWKLTGCEMRDVSFERKLENETFGYDNLRSQYGITGPRAGMAVIMENPAGETFELIHVDRQSFPGECSTDNPHLFLQ